MDHIQFNKLNTDGFINIASYYDTIYAAPDPFNNNEYHNLLYYIKEHSEIPGNKVLDAGCGTGNFSIYISNFGYNVTGIDLSDNMLLVARNKLSLLKKSIQHRNELIKRPDFMIDPNAKITLSAVEPKLKFIKDNILKLNLINEKYNIITALDLISYIHPEDMPDLIASLSNLLYKKCICVFSFNTENYYKNMIDAKFEDNNFNCCFNYSYNSDTKYFSSKCVFNESAAIQKPFNIDFVQYPHSLKSLLENLINNNFHVTKIIPDTPVYSINEFDINIICDSIESTYSNANGVKRVTVIALKTI